tara:strand:+ start:112 stop:594 length:483 start_codon:yes stop_codon:yes gene_type:complete
MPTITPTLTLVANKNTATTPGPLSMALSLSATDALLVDNVESEIHTITTTTASHVIVDGSTLVGSGVGGTDGGWIYMKNVTVSGDYLIYIGFVPADNTADLAADTPSTGTATIRSFSLKPGEFAFFPYDYIGDIIAEASNNGTGDTVPKLEVWRFDRSLT